MTLLTGRRWGSWRAAPCAVLLLVSLALPSRAASVQVVVVDSVGTPLPGTRIRLIHDVWADDPGNAGPSIRSDASGSARFEELLPGRYRVTLDAEQDGFVRPEDFLPSAPVRVDIRDLADKVRARLTLHRGPRVRLGFHVENSERRRRATVMAIDLDTRQQVRFALDQDEPRIVSLLPGRWNLTLDPPAGLLLSELRADGKTVQSHQVNIDLRDLGKVAEIDWGYAAMAQIVGHVRLGEGASLPRPVEARASLIRPGTWYDDVRRRGGSDFGRAAAAVDPDTGRFVLELSSGRWKVELVGPDGATLPVPAQKLDLEQGRVGAVDFELDLADVGARPAATNVALAAPEAMEPAATGRLYCRDGTRLPRKVDVRIRPASAGLQAVLRRDAVALTGDLLDRVTVGPLPESRYTLDMRPVGFDRWTRIPTDGATTGPIDFGAIAIDCAPRLRVSLEVTSGQPPPDLRDVADDERRFGLEGTIRTPEGDVLPVADYRVESTERTLIVHGLPAGEADLRVSLGHALFLPDYRLELPVDGTLTHGRTLEVKAVLDDVGGAIALHSRGGIAARLMAEDGRERRAVFREGNVRLSNLPPGYYRLDVCGDTACRNLLHSWSTVVIRPLQLVDLSWPPTGNR